MYVVAPAGELETKIVMKYSLNQHQYCVAAFRWRQRSLSELNTQSIMLGYLFVQVLPIYGQILLSILLSFSTG